jgi:DNA-binding NarL/FixJ family response regulator
MDTGATVGYPYLNQQRGGRSALFSGAVSSTSAGTASGMVTPSPPLGDAGERRIRVVILDERPIPRAATRQALAHDNRLEVIGEANGSQAGEALVLHTHPDVIVCSVNGPGVEYLRLFSRLRRQGVAGRIVLLASGIDAIDVLSAVEAGVNGYLLLSEISPYELARAVRQVAEGGAPFHPRAAGALVAQVARVSRLAARDAMRARGLSEREVDVLTLLTRGLRDRDIAARLVLSKTTIKTHLRSIFRKLGVHTRVQAASIAIHHRLAGDGESTDLD